MLAFHQLDLLYGLIFQRVHRHIEILEKEQFFQGRIHPMKLLIFILIPLKYHLVVCILKQRLFFLCHCLCCIYTCIGSSEMFVPQKTQELCK